MSSSIFGDGHGDIVHWESSPNKRGTFDILTTCLVTMLLCVWTAVHLNIPEPNRPLRQFLRKTAWLVLALLAPEFIAYTAWYQRREATSLMDEVNRTMEVTAKGPVRVSGDLEDCVTEMKDREGSSDSGDCSQRHPWTRRHGFFALMGGYSLELPAELTRGLPETSSRIRRLTTPGLQGLARARQLHNLPDLSREDIDARSNADTLAKGLVCIQALWFISQCITRLACHAPISLLELNTAGHAICALIIYGLWWEKPFEVGSPVVVNSSYLQRGWAHDWMKIHDSTGVPKEVEDRLNSSILWQDVPYDPGLIIQFIRDGNLKREYDVFRFSLEKDREDGSLVFPETYQTECNAADRTGERVAVCLSASEGRLWTDETSFKRVRFRPIPVERPLMYLDRASRNRWELARQWQPETFKFRVHDPLFQTSVPDFPKILEPEEYSRNWHLLLGLSAAVTTYGGLHTLAWNAIFSSFVEQIMWRVSSIVVLSSAFIIWYWPVAWELQYAVFKEGRGNLNEGQERDLYDIDATERVSRKTRMSIGLRSLWTLWRVYAGTLWRVYARTHHRSYALPYALICVYGAARAYLVVESFIQLFNLPAGVFDMPQWTTYFPHIT